MFKDKSIMITGGTGSFGHQMSRYLLEYCEPARVVIYSRDEFKQFEMQEMFSDKRMQFVIGDVRDVTRLTAAMNGIDYVVHAAAIKHVPVAEYNPMECVKTNINGAENIIAAANANRVKQVVALSTDKAANPVNLYGATKLAADKIFVAANNQSVESQTTFSIVRYGNVVCSRGSVIPYFKQMLEQGARELPVTDERMTRFWLTLEHGVDFVINAFKRMQGGEIFVPKIPSMRILDLVKSLDDTVGHYIIGMRPGEKLHEVMCSSDDSHLVLEFNDYYVIQPTISMVRSLEYGKNNLGEVGKPVELGFEYSSLNNDHFLTVDELRDLNKKYYS